MLGGCWQGCRKGEDVVQGREIRGSAGDEMGGGGTMYVYTPV